jgi:hypothetical protein
MQDSNFASEQDTFTDGKRRQRYNATQDNNTRNKITIAMIQAFMPTSKSGKKPWAYDLCTWVKLGLTLGCHDTSASVKVIRCNLMAF